MTVKHTSRIKIKQNFLFSRHHVEVKCKAKQGLINADLYHYPYSGIRNRYRNL